jgi:uncharacterized phage protein gp47/JayE
MLFTHKYSEIYNKIIKDLSENTPITNFGDSSTSGILATVVADALSDIHSRIDDLLNGMYIDTAEGVYLDKLGAIFGLTRSGYTRAYSTYAVKFYPMAGLTVAQLIQEANKALSTPISSIVINAGTLITSTADSDIAYETTEDYTLEDGDWRSVSAAPVVAIGAGSTYNADPYTLTTHNIASNQGQLMTISDLILVSNIEGITSGTDLEPQASFRRRIINARLAAVSSNETSIKEAALTVPGVGEILVTQYPEGLGTIGIVVMPTTGLTTSSSLLAAVHETVNNVVAAGSRAIVCTPEYRLLTLKARLSYDSKVSTTRQEELKGMAKSAVISYTNNLPIGGEWVWGDAVKSMTNIGFGGEVNRVSREDLRIKPYYKSIKVTNDGKAQIVTDITHNSSFAGSVVDSHNERLIAKYTNPPQKFLMTPGSVTIC